MLQVVAATGIASLLRMRSRGTASGYIRSSWLWAGTTGPNDPLEYAPTRSGIDAAVEQTGPGVKHRMRLERLQQPLDRQQ